MNVVVLVRALDWALARADVVVVVIVVVDGVVGHCEGDGLGSGSSLLLLG